MLNTADRIMFEIYREPAYNRRYHVVYFTELDDHNKEWEINAAMAGEHFYDGFIAGRCQDEAKRAIADILDRLNGGQTLQPSDVDASLQPYMPD